jgi:hypothetical protein
MARSACGVSLWLCCIVWFALVDVEAVQGIAMPRCACFMVVLLILLFPWKSGWRVCICVKYAGSVVGDVCLLGC